MEERASEPIGHEVHKADVQHKREAMLDALVSRGEV